jgi:DNA-binding CsgD family transcriptional regulator
MGTNSSVNRPPMCCTFRVHPRGARRRRWLDKRLVADLMETVSALPSNPASAYRPFGLTPREREVLTLVVAAQTRKSSRAFAVSEETVKHHLTRMVDKVGASSRLTPCLDRDRGRSRERAGLLMARPKSCAPPHGPWVLRSVVTSG